MNIRAISLLFFASSLHGICASAPIDWDAELKTLGDMPDLFWMNQPAARRDEGPLQIFSITQIRGAVYGANDKSGSIIYDGRSWAVGESRDFGGRKITLDGLSRLPDGTGKAQFNESGTIRDVQIGEAIKGIQRTIEDESGWLYGDGREAIVPLGSGIKKDDLVQVYLPNNGRITGRVVAIATSGWARVSLSKTPLVPSPKVVEPPDNSTVLIVSSVTSAHRTIKVPLASLKQDLGNVPGWVLGAVVVDSESSLVGFISPTRPARFEKAATKATAGTAFRAQDRSVRFER